MNKKLVATFVVEIYQVEEPKVKNDTLEIKDKLASIIHLNSIEI